MPQKTSANSNLRSMYKQQLQKVVLSIGLFLIGSVSLQTDAFAQREGFGIGLILGEPTGISGKYWIGSTTAVDGGVAWSFVDDGALHLHSDFLKHSFGLIEVEQGAMPVYYGGGARMSIGEDFRFGIRGVVGLNYHFGNAPVDVFIEIAPIFDLIPATTFYLNGGVGVRYFLQGE
jgi:hypothetical protein